MNPYDVLRVKENATQEDIKNAYKKLVERYDLNEYLGDPKFAQMQIEKINNAYNLLSNKKAKHLYDSKNQNHIASHYSKSDLYSKYYKKEKYNQFIDNSLNLDDENYSDNNFSNNKVIQSGLEASSVKLAKVFVTIVIGIFIFNIASAILGFIGMTLQILK